MIKKNRILVFVLFIFAVSGKSAFSEELPVADNFYKSEKAKIQKLANQINGFKVSISGKIKEQFKLETVEDSELNYLYKARYYYSIGDFAHANALITKGFKKNKLQGEHKFIIAQGMLKAGLFEKAKETTISDPYYNEAFAKLQLNECAQRNCDYFDRKFKSYLKNVKAKTKDNQMLYALGKTFFFKGEFDKAKYVFNAIDKKDFNYLRANFFITSLKIFEKQYSEAIIDLKALNKQIEKIKGAKSNIAQQLVDQINIAIARIYYELGEYQAAIEQYGKVNSNDSPQLLLEIAWCFYHLNKIELANYVLDNIQNSDKDSRVNLDKLVLKANIAILLNDYESANNLYDSIENIHNFIRKEIENVIEKNQDFKSVINIITSINSDSSEAMKPYKKLLADWIKLEDLNQFDEFLKGFNNSILLEEELSNIVQTINKFYSQYFSKRGDYKKYLVTKETDIFDEAIIRELQDSLVNVYETERKFVCDQIDVTECSFSENGFNKKNRQAPDLLEEFANFKNKTVKLGEIKAKYNIKGETLRKLEELEFILQGLVAEYLTLEEWTRLQVFEKITGYKQQEVRIKTIQKDLGQIKNKYALLVYNDAMKIYAKAVQQINKYQYNVTIGRVYLVINQKRYLSENFMQADKENSAQLTELKKAFDEVMSGN